MMTSAFGWWLVGARVWLGGTLIGGGDEHGVGGPVAHEVEHVAGPHVDQPKAQLARSRTQVLRRLATTNTRQHDR